MLKFHSLVALLSVLFFSSTALVSNTALAGDILFVSDSGADMGIATVLMGEGHMVTVVTGDFTPGNPGLKADLSGYDAVFWSASATGFGDVHSDATVFTNLTNYVMAGGLVFVTGYDSVASPTDPMLVAFVGGTGSSDGGATLGAIVEEENSLNSGVVDLTGVIPSGGSSDRDSLTGLMPDTIDVAPGDRGRSSWTLRTLGAGEIAYVSNGDSSMSSHASWATTTAGPTGAYNGAIRNFAAAADRGTSDPGAPEVEFTGERGVDEGAELVVTAAITDPEGDSFTFSWDLDDDGEFGENEGMLSYTIAAGTTDGPDAVRVAIRAVDAGGNTSERFQTVRVRNVDPVIASSVDSTVASVGAAFIYDLVVDDPGGAFDPLVYTLVNGPDRMVISAEGRLSWTPNETEVTVADENYEVELSVDDGDGGVATQSFALTVSPNRAPSSPRPLYPIGGVALLDTMPRLAAENSMDPDVEDTLTYFFRLDTVDTFDSPDLRESGEVAQTPGFTAWPMTEALPLGTYFWQVWVSDGTFSTEPTTDTFSVTSEEPIVPDGGTDPDGGMTGVDAGTTPPPPSDDGGCSAASPARNSSWMALLLMLGLLIRRRPRQG